MINNDQMTTDDPVVMLFPGQGSQYPGMCRDVLRCPTGRELIEQTSDASGLPLRELMTNADAAALADPEVAQLSVLVHSLALLQQLAADGIQPHLVAGHSLGEYTALIAAGMLGLETAVRLVARRGRAMADAARLRPGAMGVVVGLSGDHVAELCHRAEQQPVTTANINSTRQLVISGTPAGVDQVLAQAAAASALRAKRLRVGGAYHSSLMAPAAATMCAEWESTELGLPHREMISSITGAVVTDPIEHADRMRAQVSEPVHWLAVMNTLEALTRQPPAARLTVVEVGPGRVLAGLAREHGLPLGPPIRAGVRRRSDPRREPARTLAAMSGRASR